MSQHRYPCTAEPPPPILTESSHQHACIHDEPAQVTYRPIEHQCACGMTWQMASDWTPRPAPDTSWITTEPARGTGAWPWVLGVCAVMVLLFGVGVFGIWLVKP